MNIPALTQEITAEIDQEILGSLLALPGSPTAHSVRLEEFYRHNYAPLLQKEHAFVVFVKSLSNEHLQWCHDQTTMKWNLYFPNSTSHFVNFLFASELDATLFKLTF